MTKHILLIDGNSVGHAAHNGTKLTVGGFEVQAIFGFIKSLRTYRVKFPDSDPWVLWDHRAEFRFELFPGYKDREGKSVESDAKRESYRSQTNKLRAMLMYLGIRQMSAKGFEADDVAAQLSRKLSKMGFQITLITGDKDWLQLLDENVSWYEHRTEDWVTISDIMAKTGYADTKSFIQGKAMTGDTSDTIPGIGGFGEKGALEFLAQHGSVIDFLKKAKAGEIKKLKAAELRLVENEPPKASSKYGEMAPPRDAFLRNMKLMDLGMAPKIDQDSITNLKQPLNRESFLKLANELAFHSIIDDFDNWVRPFE